MKKLFIASLILATELVLIWSFNWRYQEQNKIDLAWRNIKLAESMTNFTLDHYRGWVEDACKNGNEYNDVEKVCGKDSYLAKQLYECANYYPELFFKHPIRN